MKHPLSMILRSQREKLQYLFDRVFYTGSFFFDDSFTPLFIIAAGRSGSAYLTSLLLSLDKVFMHNEIFSRSHDPLFHSKIRSGMTVEQKMLHLKKVLQSPSAHYCKLPFQHENFRKENTLYRGGKLMDNDLSEQEISLDILFTFFPSAKVIILYREDLALQFLSLQCASVNNVWHIHRDEDLRTITIELESLLDYAHDKQLFYRTCYEASQKFPDQTLFFSYETLCRDVEAVFKERVCPFLGIPYKQPSSTLKKQNILGYDICTNWTEIAPHVPENIFCNRPPFLL